MTEKRNFKIKTGFTNDGEKYISIRDAILYVEINDSLSHSQEELRRNIIRDFIEILTREQPPPQAAEEEMESDHD